MDSNLLICRFLPGSSLFGHLFLTDRMQIESDEHYLLGTKNQRYLVRLNVHVHTSVPHNIPSFDGTTQQVSAVS